LPEDGNSSVIVFSASKILTGITPLFTQRAGSVSSTVASPVIFVLKVEKSDSGQISISAYDKVK